MSDVSPLLALPLILADQAQKHVSHNEAIDLLDVLVQLVVEQIDAITPPPAAVEGAVWALGEVPVGAWAGQALRLASWRGGTWVFIAPAIGWRAWVRGAGVLRVFTGSGWIGLLGANDLQNLGGVGINTTSDANNKLAVASAATLLSHAGAGHQLKVNKATPGDTASLLFQSGWSGRAEMGLAGNDDFSVKVSADGSVWNTGLTVAASSGAVTAAAGLLLADGTAATPGLRFAADADTGLYRPAANQIGLAAGGVQRALLSDTALSVSVPITGTAVQTDRSDVATPGKLVRTDGALAAALASFGGTHTTNIGRNINTVEAGDAGLYINTNPGTWPAPTPGDSGYWWIATQRTFTDNAVFQIASPYRYAGVPTNTNQFFRVKSRTDGLWSSWVRYLTTGNLLGAVSQSAGVPTGAVIESGSNANGRYTKFASGLLECRQTMAAASGAAVTWTFPSAFIEGPVVTGNAIATVLSALCLDAAPTTTAVTFSARDKTDARRADVVHLDAVGRWSTMV